MTELNQFNSYPCPKCGQPKPKDDWEWCGPCRDAHRAAFKSFPDKVCPHCNLSNPGERRRCSACGLKLRPKGKVRDLTATQEEGKPSAGVFEKPADPPHRVSPLVSGMLDHLPESGSMEIDERLHWLQLMEANLALAYAPFGEGYRIEIRLVWKPGSLWSRLRRFLGRPGA